MTNLKYPRSRWPINPDPATHLPTLALRVADWLLACPGVSKVQPGIIGIKGRAYAAVRYSTVLETLPGCVAWDRGERTYVRHAVYVVGPLPRCVNPGGRTSLSGRFAAHRKGYFRWADSIDGADWYVSGYQHRTPEALRAEGFDTRIASPFGPFFMLDPWTDEARIDADAETPAPRHVVTWSSVCRNEVRRG